VLDHTGKVEHVKEAAASIASSNCGLFAVEFASDLPLNESISLSGADTGSALARPSTFTFGFFLLLVKSRRRMLTLQPVPGNLDRLHSIGCI
jgi:hypothetical protein